jgi:hypothetical protein
VIRLALEAAVVAAAVMPKATVCFLKVSLKKFKFFIYLFKINIFYIFDHFNMLILKIVFKK